MKKTINLIFAAINILCFIAFIFSVDEIIDISWSQAIFILLPFIGALLHIHSATK